MHEVKATVNVARTRRYAGGPRDVHLLACRVETAFESLLGRMRDKDLLPAPIPIIPADDPVTGDGPAPFAPEHERRR
jgi:hypothetical protein